MDLTQAKVGKLCVDTGSFVIEETLGELEFEVEENEVTLNLNKAVTSEGEWGIFLPVAAAGAVAEGAAGAANGTAKVVSLSFIFPFHVMACIVPTPFFP